MKRKNLFLFTLFLCFATSNLIAQSYMTLSDNPQVIGYTGSHLDLAIPTNPSPYNLLRFTLKGGDGGDRYVNYEFTTYRAEGGIGATTYCEFRVGSGSALEPGGTLRFIVGQKGTGTNGIGTEGCGGGGGTGLLYLAPGLNATTASNWVILAVAGGGGGAYANGVGGKKDGNGGNDNPDGSGSNGDNSSDSDASDPHGTGGQNGDGGLASDGGTSGGAGGGGYSGDGQVIGHASASNCTGTGGSKGGILGGDGGKDDSCVDGRDGGWGYGGGGSGEAAGGGGGGYSGGGGGTAGVGYSSGGGGGGSYVEQSLAESFILTKGETTSDPQNGIILYEFDSEGPSINSCNNFLISLNASGQVTIDATTILNEYYAPPNATITSTQSIFDCDDIGDNIVIVTITDTEGNTATCNAFIEIEDNTIPTAICKSVILPLNANGEGTLTANAVDNGSSDACGIGFKSINKTSFDCDDVGSNTVILTVYDPSGNPSTCSATITVQDQVNPIAYCQNITIQLDENGQATIDEEDIDNGSSDACGIDSRTLSRTSFGCNKVGFNVVILMVTDVNANSDFCTAEVVVQDQIAPIANCQDITIQLDENGQATIDEDDIDNGSSDACGIDSKSLSKTSFSCNDVGLNAVVLTVSDVDNNSDFCTAEVIVQDQVAPVAQCLGINIIFQGNGSGVIDIDIIDEGSNDACGIASRSVSPSSWSCSDLGPNTVTLTVTDNNGNTATCTNAVTFRDTVKPVAICQDVTVQLDENGSGSTSAEDVDNGSNDHCGIASLSLSQTDFDCSHVGDNTVTLTATDVNSNSKTCAATVTVQDQVIPMALCQNLTIQLDNSGQATTTANAIDDGSSDACGIQSLTITQTDFDCNDVGTNTVTLTATDVNGNSNTCSATVTVQDQVIPMALCQNITIQLDDSGQASTTVNAIDNGSSDACGIQSLTITQTDFDCDDVGANTVTLTATDVNGNSNTCSATVTVQDQVIPVALCQNVTIQLDDSGQGSTNADAIDNGSSDACGIQSLTITQSDFDCSEIGDNTVTMTVTDANGNSNTCSASVIVEDNIPPVAICQDITVDFNGEQSIGWTVDQLWDEAGSSDNCVEIFATNQSLTEATCDQLGSVLNVTVTIEDGSGNESTCNANVTVDGLPCGWYSDQGGINCAGAETDYDTNTGEFSLTSEGCYAPSYYRYSDTHGFIQTELCGDGEISAQITSVIGTGWAGISMRESNDPSAKMIQLMLNGSTMTRREVRMSTGGAAFTHMYQTLGQNWLKLSRSGNQFSAYHSSDGINWSTVFVTNLSMPDCIDIGLITMNGASTGEVSGLFENVSLIGVNALVAPGSIQVTTEEVTISDFTLYPNPATDEINIELDNFIQGKEVHIRIYNHYGQVVLERQLVDAPTTLIPLQLGGLPGGTYLVEVQSDEGRTSKKLVLSPF